MFLFELIKNLIAISLIYFYKSENGNLFVFHAITNDNILNFFELVYNQFIKSDFINKPIYEQHFYNLNISIITRYIYYISIYIIKTTINIIFWNYGDDKYINNDIIYYVSMMLTIPYVLNYIIENDKYYFGFLIDKIYHEYIKFLKFMSMHYVRYIVDNYAKTYLNYHDILKTAKASEFEFLVQNYKAFMVQLYDIIKSIIISSIINYTKIHKRTMYKMALNLILKYKLGSSIIIDDINEKNIYETKQNILARITAKEWKLLFKTSSIHEILAVYEYDNNKNHNIILQFHELNMMFVQICALWTCGLFLGVYCVPIVSLLLMRFRRQLEKIDYIGVIILTISAYFVNYLQFPLLMAILSETYYYIHKFVMFTIPYFHRKITILQNIYTNIKFICIHTSYVIIILKSLLYFSNNNYSVVAISAIIHIYSYIITKKKYNMAYVSICIFGYFSNYSLIHLILIMVTLLVFKLHNRISNTFNRLISLLKQYYKYNYKLNGKKQIDSNYYNKPLKKETNEIMMTDMNSIIVVNSNKNTNDDGLMTTKKQVNIIESFYR